MPTGAFSSAPNTGRILLSISWTHRFTSILGSYRSVPATTHGLLALTEWLTAHGCTHVAMEATGVYWKPVWHVLEEHFTLILANAMHIRNVPGRKSDVNDCGVRNHLS
jgi:transposase